MRARKRSDGGGSEPHATALVGTDVPIAETARVAKPLWLLRAARIVCAAAMMLAIGAVEPTKPPSNFLELFAARDREASDAAVRNRLPVDRAGAKRRLEGHGLRDVSSLRFEQGRWRATGIRNDTTIEVWLAAEGELVIFRQ